MTEWVPVRWNGPDDGLGDSEGGVGGNEVGVHGPEWTLSGSAGPVTTKAWASFWILRRPPSPPTDAPQPPTPELMLRCARRPMLRVGDVTRAESILGETSRGLHVWTHFVVLIMTITIQCHCK